MAPPDELPAYLRAADHLWASTHDSHRVRKMLQKALNELAVSDRDGGRAPFAAAAVEGDADAELPAGSSSAATSPRLTLVGDIPVADAAVPSAIFTVVQLRRPVAISISNGGHRARHSEWRQQWGAWLGHLQKLSQPFDGLELSAIEMSIETL